MYHSHCLSAADLLSRKIVHSDGYTHVTVEGELEVVAILLFNIVVLLFATLYVHFRLRFVANPFGK